LHAYLLEVGLAPEILVAQWMGTLFAYSLPLSLVTEMWGYVFSSFPSTRKKNIEGNREEGAWPSMFRVAMALLGDREEDVLNMDLQELSVLLRRWSIKKESHGDKADSMKSSDIQIEEKGSGFEMIIKRADKLSNRINAEVLASLEQDFAIEVLSYACPLRCVSPSSISSFESAINGFMGLGLGVVAGFGGMTGFGASYDDTKEESKHGESEIAEDSVGWLSRYGASKTTLLERDSSDVEGEGERMRRIREELDVRRALVEKDKQSILPKIQKACDALRRCELERKCAESDYVSNLYLFSCLILRMNFNYKIYSFYM
jgi:hypothetical protein